MDEELKQKITQVQIEHGHKLLDKAHVVGVAIGMKKVKNVVTGQLSLVVMVDKKLPLEELDEEDRIPTKIDAVITDVQETGFFTAQG